MNSQLTYKHEVYPMIYRNSIGLIALVAVVFAVPVVAQAEEVGGIFYASCGPNDGPAVTMELDTHLRITVFESMLKADEAYRTIAEVFEGEQTTMEVSQCDAKMENCKLIEGVLTTYKADGKTINAALEAFDGTETQGDAESIQGKLTYFSVHRDKNRSALTCND